MIINKVINNNVLSTHDENNLMMKNNIVNIKITVMERGL